MKNYFTSYFHLSHITEVNLDMPSICVTTLATVIILILLPFGINQYEQQQVNASGELIPPNESVTKQAKYQLMPDVHQQLLDKSNKIKDKAVLLIYTDDDWSGSILDSSGNSASQQGSRDSKIIFDCKNGTSDLDDGIYSLNIQKENEQGLLHLAVIRDGKILKDGSTTADFGIVSFSGNC
jgi:hypothetical protein